VLVLRSVYRTARLIALIGPADQFYEGPNEFLHGEQRNRFKDQFHVFGHPNIGQRITPDPVMLLARTSTLNTGALVGYNMTCVELTTFTFSAVSKSLSLYNDILGPIPERLLSPW